MTSIKSTKKYFLELSDQFCKKFYSSIFEPFDQIRCDILFQTCFYHKYKSKAFYFRSLKAAEKVAEDISGMGIKVQIKTLIKAKEIERYIDKKGRSVEKITSLPNEEKLVKTIQPGFKGGPLFLAVPGRWMKVVYPENTKSSITLFEDKSYLSLNYLQSNSKAYMNSHKTIYNSTCTASTLYSGNGFLMTPVIPTQVDFLDFRMEEINSDYGCFDVEKSNRDIYFKQAYEKSRRLR